MRLSLLLVFVSLVILFIAFTTLFFRLTSERHWNFAYLAVPMFVISILGGVLIFLTFKQNVSGLLKVFLMLVGFAPAAMILSIILHNAVCALFTSLLKKEVEEPVFFLLGIIGCPAAFLVGTIGSITMIIRYAIAS